MMLIKEMPKRLRTKKKSKDPYKHIRRDVPPPTIRHKDKNKYSRKKKYKIDWGKEIRNDNSNKRS